MKPEMDTGSSRAGGGGSFAAFVNVMTCDGFQEYN